MPQACWNAFLSIALPALLWLVVVQYTALADSYFTGNTARHLILDTALATRDNHWFIER